LFFFSKHSFIKKTGMNIFVSNLGFNIQDEDLKQLFTSFGEVSSAKIINDRETGRSRGFGFVEMSDDTAASIAIEQLNETSVEGRTMRVAEAKPRTERSSNSFGGGYDNNRRESNNRW
jgi:RNA recognition motif-containing protein